MKHKTILITGSTDGIGKLAAINLAKSGHHIIIHGRSPEKLAKVKAEIISLTGSEKIEGYVADFSKLDDVRRMANTIKEEQSKIDVLVNNAGVFKINNSIAENGLDVRMVVNYLAPFILTSNQAYAQSKLAILLWSFDLAKRHKDITTIALNPGSLLNTKMVKEAYGKFWSSADKGADIITDLATNSKYRKIWKLRIL